MQGSSNYDRVWKGHEHGLLAPRSDPRRLEGVDSALGVKMLNVSLTDIAVHYYEAQTLLREAIDRVAAAFGVEPSRVVPLQLRPDEREATACAVWTFTIRGIPSYDLLGHMREMFKQSSDAFGEWRFGSRKVLLEPFSFGLVGVADGIPSSSLSDLMAVWQRPGVDADWRHDAELWLKLRDFEWVKSLKDNSSEFEDRLLKLRNTVASIFEVRNPRALQVAKLSTASDGTIIQLT
ncbi:hypothetical protein, conserved [Eimeria necatrix]|uniref:Uncharacterized protein n=1 Tax=Eimeria necatrix TaxID=51315 RepID=U6MJV2_9EIME|nr:hypothetical protein, conserved [Eimeria necatrix]CDJ64296.1 hypothetical protein, conserved [Eimeria necatrix]